MKYFDAYPGETEQEYLIRKEEQALEEQRNYNPSSDPLTWFFKLVKFSFKVLLVLGVFIYVSYVLSTKVLAPESSKMKVWAFAIAFTYIMLSVIYFLKGIIVGLRARGRILWIVLWILCFITCCVVPAYMVKVLVQGFFPLTEHKETLAVCVSWFTFLVSLAYLNGIYQFTTDSAPRILFWSYAAGLKLSIGK